MKLFLQKNAKFSRRWGQSPQTPIGLRRLGALPPEPQHTPPQLQISGYAPGQKCLRPRTQAQVLQKKSSKHFFRRSPISSNKSLPKFFSGDLQNFNNSKKVLSSSRGQANFRGLEAKDLTFEAKDFKMCPRGLHLGYLL